MATVGAERGSRSLASLLSPRSVAVVGASPRGNRGTAIIHNLQRFGFSGDIYVVHPSSEQVLGVPAYPSLDELPEVPEFVAVAVGAELAVSSVAQAGALGSRAGLVIASGFGEGGAGQPHRDALVDAVRVHGMALCGPNCYGILNLAENFAGYSGEVVRPIEPGRVALVLQSGALTHTIMDTSVGRGLGLSHVITTGNELSVTLDEYLRALAVDEAVGVIGVFIEGIRDPESFASAARLAHANGKPVVALSVGRSQLGQRAAMAHTGALAGSSAAMSGFLDAHGVLQVDDVDEFRETLIAMSTLRRPCGPGAVLMSISGGGTGLLSDLAERVGLQLPQPDQRVSARLAEILPEFGSASNPLDATGAAAEVPQILSDAARALSGVNGAGTVAMALNVPGGSEGQEAFYRQQAQQLAKLKEEIDLPVVALSLATGVVDPVLWRTLRGAGIPLLLGARPALVALSRWLGWFDRGELRPRPEPAARGEIFHGADVIVGAPALDLIASAGVRTPQHLVVWSPQEVARAVDVVGGLAVVKIEATGVAHKSDIGGVAIGVTAASASQVADRILRDASAAKMDVRTCGFLVQAQVRGDAVEVLVGIVRDPRVGLVLSVGLGGVFVELGAAPTLAPLPVDRSTAEELTRQGPLARLLDGYRGAPAGDRAALVDVILAFSNLISALGDQIAAAELNPVMVLPTGAIAVDALLVHNDQSNVTNEPARAPVVHVTAAAARPNTALEREQL